MSKTNIWYFIAGAVIGSGITAIMYIQKLKEQEEYHNTDLQEVREFYKQLMNKKDNDSDENNDNKEISNELKTQYNHVANIYKTETPVKEGEKMNSIKEPYCIPAEEYGEYMSYEQETLVYYSDGVLVHDDTDKVINDINNTVGEFFYDHFGENDDEDVVYVRNDVLKKEFEIIKDPRSSKEVIYDQDDEELYEN